MDRIRLGLVAVVGLGLFVSGYLVGRPDAGERAVDSDIPTHTRRRSSRVDVPTSVAERSKARMPHSSVSGEHAGYRKIVDMVSTGELRINDVGINGDTFFPEDKVGDFFGLSAEQLAEMRQIGLERLQAKQNREQALAKIHEVSESGMVVDLPADPEFAAAEVARFIDNLGQSFGDDVVAMLQPSIKAAYDDLGVPRHVRYTLTKRDDLANLPADVPQEIRAMHEGMYDCKTSINQNEDGSFMKNERGEFLRGGGTSAGTMNLNDMKPDAYRARYHYLWERKMGRR